MSPPSSAQASTPSSSRAPSKPTHSRQTSTATTTAAAAGTQEPRPSKVPSPRPPPSPRQPALTVKPKVQYTCYIRLPFARGEFLDPPRVEWDAGKDRALWKVVSLASNSKDLDWEDIAARFEVDLPFLLQQAAWLYERHLEGMRRQMQKLGQSHAVPPTPPMESSSISTTPAGGGVAMQRQSSREAGAAARMPSVINTLKAQGAAGASGSGSLGSDGSSPGTPRSTHPGISRTPSTTTVTQSKILTSSNRQPQAFQRAPRTSSGSQRQLPKLLYAKTATHVGESDGAVTSESDSEVEAVSRTASQAFQRAPLGKKSAALRRVSSDGDREGEDDEDEDEGGYLPFAAASKATARGEPIAPSKQRQATGTAGPSATKSAATNTHPPPPPDSPTTSSTTSSAAQAPASTSSDSQTLPPTRPPGPLSPRHRAQIANANFSPTSRSLGRREGSDGSPSMGSSFSDLDGDASVTQSALEEALLSGVQKGNLSLIGRAVGRRG
ncbi:hypothetical protein LTR78_009390 [Recurvomyces mirabilis]|uniref:Autophagy-related protein 29 n=1 Tax=Recurvomyces mirabilis TaxID=574656 RepID=A0AAE0TSD7_9PEZI|nr:hypothetical protein LTR78_009390 [Recurvomyces mirabilis]KAK5154321.1 hypothetical protein LTS14_007006 [Recurvomyces mirabilis]